MQVALRGGCDLSGGMVRLSDATLSIGIALFLIKRFCFWLGRLRWEVRLKRCSPGINIPTKLANGLSQFFERRAHILELKYCRARLRLRVVVNIFFDGKFDAIDNFELIRDSVVKVGRFDDTG